jgi:hypothetical protein
MGQAGQAAALSATVADETEPKSHGESPIRKILIESALIVFSILLALAANDWNDSRNQHALAARALSGVRDEIEGNAQRVRDALPYLRTMEAEVFRADSLKRVHSWPDFVAAAPDWHGLGTAELDATAWQSAITLGAVSNIGYDTVRVLSRLYALQGKFDQYASGMASTIDLSDQAMASTTRKLWVYFVTVRTNDDTLLARYQSALALLKGGAKK